MFKAYFDGACQPNPGNGSIGFVIYDKDVAILSHFAFIGKATNNIAEFTALLELLKVVTDEGFYPIKIYGDSALIVNMTNGKCKSHAKHLIKLKNECDMYLSALHHDDFEPSTLEWIPRHLNTVADFLSKQYKNNN